MFRCFNSKKDEWLLAGVNATPHFSDKLLPKGYGSKNRILTPRCALLAFRWRSVQVLLLIIRLRVFSAVFHSVLTPKNHRVYFFHHHPSYNLQLLSLISSFGSSCSNESRVLRIACIFLLFLFLFLFLVFTSPPLALSCVDFSFFNSLFHTLAFHSFIPSFYSHF